MSRVDDSAKFESPTVDLAAANHTGHELELMLAGSKPLAVFHDDVSCLPDEEIIPEGQFRPYVASGELVRHEVVFSHGFDSGWGREIHVKYVLFARAAEAWRIPAFVLMREVGLKTGRNPEELERIECKLLGYTEAETDAWCARAYGSHAV